VDLKSCSEELYDHHSDPNEFTNLARNPKHDRIKNDLAQWTPGFNEKKSPKQ